MNISSSTYSISEVLDMMNRRDLVVNEEYQRAPRLWPPARAAILSIRYSTSFLFRNSTFTNFWIVHGRRNGK